MKRYVVGQKLYSNENHARWAVFLDSLGIKYQYMLDQQSNDLRITPTFYLYDYHRLEGIYLWVTEEQIVQLTDSDLFDLGKPVWHVTGEPSFKIGYLYTLKTEGNLISQSVLAGFEPAHRRHKLFTNPNAIDRQGFVYADVLDEFGKSLKAAVYAANYNVCEMDKKPEYKVSADVVLTTPVSTAIKVRGLSFSDAHTSLEFSQMADGTVWVKMGESVFKLSKAEFEQMVAYFSKK